ncbi:metallophosphoesterase [Patescibacteria group bacterium]|nr:metallophosphoesterase [Patescibacteria group bacterium]
MSNDKIYKQKILAVSDLHLCDGGPEDKFCGNEKNFEKVLNLAEKNNYQIVVLGDLFELWQCNDLEKIIRFYSGLLKRLSELNAIFILGNHDALIAQKLSSGGTFLNMEVVPEKLIINKTLFMHGHRFDWTVSLFNRLVFFARIQIETPIEKYFSKSAAKLVKKFNDFWIKKMSKFYQEGGFSKTKEHYRKKAIKYAESLPEINRIVIGHRHKPDHVLMRAGNRKIEYYNIGSWVNNRQDYLILDINTP